MLFFHSVLSENRLFGAIPKEFGQLRMLEMLDMRDNHLSGRVPAVIGDLQSLRSLYVDNLLSPCCNMFVYVYATTLLTECS